MKNLAIALATRGRPQLLLETIGRTLPNIALPSTTLHLMLDADDQPTIKAVEAAKIAWDDRIVINIAPREDTVAEKFNRVLKHEALVYTAMVDHTPHLTRGFDQKIVETAGLFPDGIACIVNHLANASFTGMYALTNKLTQKLGYLFPPYFPYWFIDHWIDDIARIIGRMAFVDVVTDSSRKPMTQEMREPAWWATWYDAGYLYRRKLAHKIICDPEFYDPHWRKTLLERHHPLIEFRSKWVNDSVRASAPYMSSNLSLKDERYQRIRAKAVAMLPALLEGLPEHEANFYRSQLVPTQIVNLKRAYA